MKLLLVGASVRAAAESAARAGHQVVAADLFGDQDLRAVAHSIRVTAYPDEFSRIRASHVDAPVIYTGALENHPKLLDQFATTGVLLGNSARVVAHVRQPELLQRVLRGNGIASPETRRQAPRDDVHQWLRKPVRSAGGRGVVRCQRDDSKTVGKAECYFQRFVPGTPCAASFVAAGGRGQLLGVTRMLVGLPGNGANEFLYRGSIQHVPGFDERSQWRRIGDVLAGEFGLMGLFGVDAVWHQGRIWPVEVNPRYTASMEVVEKGAGVSLIGLHVAACQRETLPSGGERGPGSNRFGKIVVYAPRHVRVPASLTSWAREQHLTLADVPAPGTEARAGSPVLTLLGSGDTPAHVRRRLRIASRQVARFLIAAGGGGCQRPEPFLGDA